MRKTNVGNNSMKLAVSTQELPEILGCGRGTAVKIGTEAGAKIQVGKRVIWNVEKIRCYLNSMSEGGLYE